MKYSEIKKVKEFCEGLLSSPDWRSVVEEATTHREAEFEVDDVRFIQTADIDSIQQTELLSDMYVLGCFNASFIARVISIPYKAVKAIQEAEQYEALGIMCKDHIEDIQAEYSRVDGYGHHFNSYDGSMEEVTIDGIDYYVFDHRG